MFLPLVFLFLSSLFSNKKNKIFKCDEYYEFDKIIPYDQYESIYEYYKLLTNNTSDEKIITNQDITTKEIATKYGAYNRQFKPRDDLPEKDRKKKKKNKKLNPAKFIKRLKKNKDIDKDDKPLIFVVSPQQLMIYKAYNKTMSESREKRIADSNKNNTTPHSNDNSSLPKDWNDDNYYSSFY
jgi:hypothetical protein